ncbi:hypothetical protein GWK47_049921 [Chionoecetes opilio]|uniref:Uncharacterized protein n=1 Tax=Chionoecetes opilio TaxID=41210 RepID=A0A8J4YBC6_CHIOP|nr:hypothetical protein GWK47_049921 [Chionoecetes opilio]
MPNIRRLAPLPGPAGPGEVKQPSSLTASYRSRGGEDPPGIARDAGDRLANLVSGDSVQKLSAFPTGGGRRGDGDPGAEALAGGARGVWGLCRSINRPQTLEPCGSLPPAGAEAWGFGAPPSRG